MKVAHVIIIWPAILFSIAFPILIPPTVLLVWLLVRKARKAQRRQQPADLVPKWVRA